MPPQANIANRARLHACLLIIAICGVLAACASQTDHGAITSAEAATPRAIVEHAEPRLRRDSVAHVATLRKFGNIAIESTVDARCGYRDDVTTVLCLNVAGQLNADDIERLRTGGNPATTVRVRDDSAREVVGRMHGDAVAHVQSTRISRDTGNCRGACASRIELVQPR